jgi:hypothetical protein
MAWNRRRFEVLAGVNLWVSAFRVMTLSGLLGRYRRFGGSYSLLLQTWAWKKPGHACWCDNVTWQRAQPNAPSAQSTLPSLRPLNSIYRGSGSWTVTFLRRWWPANNRFTRISLRTVSVHWFPADAVSQEGLCHAARKFASRCVSMVINMATLRPCVPCCRNT